MGWDPIDTDGQHDGDLYSGGSVWSPDAVVLGRRGPLPSCDPSVVCGPGARMAGDSHALASPGFGETSAPFVPTLSFR